MKVARRPVGRWCSAQVRLLVWLVLILLSQDSLAQQQAPAEPAREGEAAPFSNQTSPFEGRGQEDPFSSQEATPRWTEEDRLLWELDQDREGRGVRPRAGRSDDVLDPVMQDLKSLMDEYDPRDRFDLDLPVIVEDEEFLERRPPPRGSAAPGAPSAEDPDGLGAAPGGGIAGGQPSMTIGEAGDLIVDLVSDFRVYFYLLFSISVIVGGFALVAMFRRLQAKKGRRRHRRHRKRRRMGPDHSRSRRSASRRRRPAHT